MGNFYAPRDGVVFNHELPDGTVLTVRASHFTEDRSVGVPIAAEHLSICGPDGQEFPLENDIVLAISTRATEIFLGE
jgi:hypothetical protein